MSTWWLLLALAQDGKAAAESVEIPGTGLTFEIAHLPGGKARIGSPPDEAGRGPDEPAREAELRPFSIGRHEVTWDEFQVYAFSRELTKVDGVTRPSKPYEPPNGKMGTGRHPACSMRWQAAMGYCDWLSRKTGHRYRLPTEAEWEYACRAGSPAPAPQPLGDQAWFRDNSGEKNHEAGGKKPNGFGVYDMLGNVWEYCLEPYNPPDYGPVLRGGAWHDPAPELRAANRQTLLEEWYERDPNRPRSLWWLTDGAGIGFRVVRVSDAAGRREQDAYLGKLRFKGFVATPSSGGFSRVSAEVVNSGDRALEELEVMVYFLDPQGKPYLEERNGRPAFNKGYPALFNSYRNGNHARPLKPQETRKFELEVPEPYDYDASTLKLEAKATGVRFAR